jgi:hypothetical protein
MVEILQNINWILFFHLAGLIIGLGAVTVIDIMGFISRKSKIWTDTTISAHHVTKPLIWLGTFLLVITWIFLYDNSTLSNIKSLLLLIMILNGSFLSFYISPKLDKLKNKKALLPKYLQNKIAGSMIISFLSWWIFVLLTVSALS